MNFFKPKQPYSSQENQLPLHHHAFNTLQTHLFNILLRIPNPFSFSSSSSSSFYPSFYSIEAPYKYVYKKNPALSAAEIKKRMVGIRVYKVSSNYKRHHCNANSDRQPDFYFFSKQDAEDYLQECSRRIGCQIFDTPLTDMVDYEQKGHPITLVPELSQVNNAVEGRGKAIGFRYVKCRGVPVFQSDNLIIKSGQKPDEYRPAFLRKEDLEKTLAEVLGPKRASSSIIEVDCLERIIRSMKDCSTCEENDIIIVGPGITPWNWLPRD